MSKVTSKRQLTLPKAIADQYGIRAGDELQWVAAGEAIRVIPAKKGKDRKDDARLALKQRLDLFDKATLRQQHRDSELRKAGQTSDHTGRGWKREDLYDRGIPD